MKKVFSFLVVMFVITLINIQLVNADDKSSKINATEIYGEIIQEGNGVKGESTIKLDSFNIEQIEGVTKGTADITHNGVRSTLNFNGELYPVLGEGYYADNLLVGDIKTSDGYNVIQFKIENEVGDATDQYNSKLKETSLSIVLEEKETGEWANFTFDIDEQTFLNFYNGANMYLEEQEMGKLEILEKVAPLLNMHNKAEHGEIIPDEIEIEQSGYQDSNGEKGLLSNDDITTDSDISLQMTDIPVNFNELNRLMNNLKKSQNANLSDYNLPVSLFRGSGWKRDVNLNTTPRNNYYANSANQGSITISQLMVYQHDSGFGGWTGDDGLSNSFEIAYTNKHGMILEYDHNTQEVRVIYYNAGITLRDLQLAQQVAAGPEEYSVYTAQTLSGVNLSMRGSSGLVNYIAGLIPFANDIHDIWDIITNSPGTNEALGQRELFIGKDYLQQQNIHSGNVYRVASGTLDNHDFRLEGAHTNLVGEIHSGDGSIRVNWSFRTTLGTNL